MKNEKDDVSLETLVSLAKRRGFVFPSSEIYGGISGFYDYGPYGAQMVRNLKDAWWDAFVRSVPNIHGLDSAIIQNRKLWEASGHVDGFYDPMVECLKCHTAHRADHLVGKEFDNPLEYEPFLAEIECPKCKAIGKFGKVEVFNMMFKTVVGPKYTSVDHKKAVSLEAEVRFNKANGSIDKFTLHDDFNELNGFMFYDQKSVGFLRPETAGGIFANFDQVLETTRAKLPFGIAQIGKAFRNEISPREFLFRVREFEQMEIEYFVNPENADAELESWKQIAWDWLKVIGLNEDNLEWHQHDDAEKAHYAADSWDINYAYPFGSKELWGIANRTDYDLKAHSEGSGKDLTYFDTAKNEHITPYVIEPSIGVSRLMLAALHSAYTEEEVEGEKRVVLKLAKGISPVDVAILPLSKKPKLQKVAHELYAKLVGDTNLTVEYDETQSIGKRYRRQDEIGTPKCITVDFETLEDKAVTIRDRDTMEQKRVSIDEIVEQLR